MHGQATSRSGCNAMYCMPAYFSSADIFSPWCYLGRVAQIISPDHQMEKKTCRISGNMENTNHFHQMAALSKSPYSNIKSPYSNGHLGHAARRHRKRFATTDQGLEPQRWGQQALPWQTWTICWPICFGSVMKRRFWGSHHAYISLYRSLAHWEQWMTSI